MKLGRIFLLGLAGSITLCALYGIFVVLTGSYSPLAGKIMLTTLSVGGYSLTGLCCTPHLEEADYKKGIAYAGIAVSAIGLVYACFTNWTGFSGWSGFWVLLQFRFIFLTLAISIAHISLLLIIKPGNKLVAFSQRATVFVVCAVSLIVVAMLIKPEVWLVLTQLLIVLAILDALGSIVTPILHKATAVPTT